MFHRTKNRQGSSKTLPIFIKKPAAFTLVEIIIVVIIISMLLGITVLSISLIFSRQLDSDSRKLLADIYWTREMTVSSHNEYIVTIDTSNESYTLTDTAGNAIKPTQRLKVDIVSAPNTITFQAPFATAVLNPTGSDVITLSYEAKQKQLRIYPQTGYLKIE